MSIRLIQPIFIAGVHKPVTGNTLNLSADFEAYLVNTNSAVWVDDLSAGGAVPVMAVNNSLTGEIEYLSVGIKKLGVGGTYTWATKPLASVLSGQIFLSDVGVGGSYWYSDGSKWRPVGGRVTLKNTITDITNSGAPAVVLDYVTLPAGFVADGDILEIDWAKERTGGTADTDATSILLGSAAMTPGTSIGLSTSVLATTVIHANAKYAIRKESSAIVRPMTIAGSVGVGGAAVPNLANGVNNMDTTTTYLQITSDLTTGSGSEVVHLRRFTVTLVAGS